MAILALSLAATGTAHAATDDDEINSERPDFVNSAEVLKARQFQLEGGIYAERRRDGARRERNSSTPVLLRAGLGHDTELQLESEGYLREHADGERSTGWADATLGLVHRVRDQDGAVPALAVQLQAELPTGSRAFRNHGVLPTLSVPLQWDLAGGLGLGMMPGIGVRQNDEGKRFTAALFGIGLERAWGERTKGFVELAAPQIAHARDGGTLASLDVGMSYLLSKHCLVDAALFRGLNHRTADLGVTVGLSYRP
ncbi:MAG: transporter [Gammaproteobacteria bacterium]